MSQIWCCLVLSAILGLCGSAILKKEEISDEVIGIEKEPVENLHKENKFHEILDQFQNTLGAKSGKKKAKRPPIPNKARQDEDCHYPYRFAPPDCYYSVQFGNRKDGDKKVRSRIYKKPATQQTPYTFEIKYPQPNAKNTRPINFIKVNDPENTKSEDIFDDNIVVTQGGINKSYVTIQITTNNPEQSKYQVEIFAKNK